MDMHLRARLTSSRQYRQEKLWLNIAQSVATRIIFLLTAILATCAKSVVFILATCDKSVVFTLGAGDNIQAAIDAAPKGALFALE